MQLQDELGNLCDGELIIRAKKTSLFFRKEIMGDERKRGRVHSTTNRRKSFCAYMHLHESSEGGVTQKEKEEKAISFTQGHRRTLKDQNLPRAKSSKQKSFKAKVFLKLRFHGQNLLRPKSSNNKIKMF